MFISLVNATAPVATISDPYFAISNSFLGKLWCIIPFAACAFSMLPYKKYRIYQIIAMTAVIGSYVWSYLILSSFPTIDLVVMFVTAFLCADETLRHTLSCVAAGFCATMEFYLIFKQGSYASFIFTFGVTSAIFTFITKTSEMVHDVTIKGFCQPLLFMAGLNLLINVPLSALITVEIGTFNGLFTVLVAVLMIIFFGLAVMSEKVQKKLDAELGVEEEEKQ